MAKCKHETKNGRCGLKESYAYRKECHTEEFCRCHDPIEPCGRSEPITNADRIRAMSDAELAGFIIHIAYDRGTMWCEPFSRKFCDNCPTTECTIEETGITMDLHECDFLDGVCPHGSDVMWWLEQPAE